MVDKAANREIKLKRAETGVQSPSCKVGNLVADEGKPTAGVQGVVEKWQRSRLLESAQTVNKFSVAF